MSYFIRFIDNISYKGGNVEKSFMSVKLGIVKAADRQALLNLSILLRCLTMEDLKNRV
jgi:uncharacterized protein